MTETVIFKIDKKLKTKAMRKAKEEGVPLSVVLKEATEAYVADQFEVGIVYNPKFIEVVHRASKEPTVRGDLKKLIKKF